MRYPILLAGILLAPLAALGQPRYTITTLAGNGTAGFAGDDGAAGTATLNYPVGIALDSSGNLLIADTFNARIRRVSTANTISTIAGNGTSALAGDGGAATSASLNNPCSIAVDSAGNIYVADTRNHVIRRIASGGTITKIAGTGEPTFIEDGIAANEATLNTPLGVALDSSGNLYVADTFNHRIRRIATGGTITTVAGTGVSGYFGDNGAATDAGLSYPQGVFVDTRGNLYIADTFNDRIRKVGTDGIITTVAGNGIARFRGDRGPATSASLNYPKAVAVDAAGNIFIVDSFNSRVRMVTEDGVIRTIAGTGQFADYGEGGLATQAALRFPWGIALGSGGRIFIADTDNGRIKVLTPQE